jgi:hypothetical protein
LTGEAIGQKRYSDFMRLLFYYTFRLMFDNLMIDELQSIFFMFFDSNCGTWRSINNLPIYQFHQASSTFVINGKHMSFEPYSQLTIAKKKGLKDNILSTFPSKLYFQCFRIWENNTNNFY